MGSIRNTVYYCCIWNGARVLYAYNAGEDGEIENLAQLCLQKAPSHHKWYFQTMFNKTFGFLMEDGYVYFAIVDQSLGNPRALDFLQQVREEFKKAAKNVSKRSKSNPNSLVLQEQLVPVIHRLITSLSDSTGIETLPSPSDNNNGQINIPLLGKSSKQEKRKGRDHVISVRENGALEEHRKSADRGVSKPDSSSLDCGNQAGPVGAFSLTKEVSSMRNRPSSQKKWCRQVRIVLAIDAAVCLTLFVVWIVVCGGTECIS